MIFIDLRAPIRALLVTHAPCDIPIHCVLCPCEDDTSSISSDSSSVDVPARSRERCTGRKYANAKEDL